MNKYILYIHMVKNLTIKDEAYQYLTSIKQKKGILSFYGIDAGNNIDTTKLRRKMQEEFSDRS